jgi:dihydrodipicolinate synthase/N-acetylneuraminate lyase
MKYMLELQGVIPCSKMREPALDPSADEKKIIERLFDRHGLHADRWLPAGRKFA